LKSLPLGRRPKFQSPIRPLFKISERWPH